MIPRTPDEDLFIALVGWLEGGPRPASLDEHERADPEGFARARRIAEGLLASLGEARLAPQRPAARARALDLLRPGLVSQVRTLLARAIPLPREPELALRSGAAPFQALYQAEGYDVDLLLSEDGHLQGQILPQGGSPGLGGGTCLLEVGADAASAPIEPDGSFEFEHFPTGSARLVLEREGLEIVLEGLELPTP